MRPILIAPSLLAADPGCLGDEARRAEESGADWLHMDIMDGHFVPNLSFGPSVLAAAKRHTHLPLDVHLMLTHPDRYIEAFAKAGASLISVHVEAQHDVAATLRRIRDLGCKPAIALNPDTPMERAEPFLAEVELVLAMTVYPGFGGQSLISDVLDKCLKLKEMRDRVGHDFDIEVDGGVGLDNVGACAAAGANVFVAGTALYAPGDMAGRIRRMRAVAEAAVSSGSP